MPDLSAQWLYRMPVLMHAKLSLFATLVTVLLIGGGTAFGQDLGGSEGLRSEGTSYHVFARPGQNTIQVFLLGDVGQSGVFMIGENIDLAQLVALAGGPVGTGRSRTTIRLYRPEDGKRTLLYEADAEEFIEQSSYPSLRTGDVIQVESIERRGFGWRDALTLITTAASLTLTYERLFVD